MLSNNYRFHGHGSLGYVYRNGESARSHLFTLRYTKNPRRNQSRFAVVVSKKVLKSAVGRNRIRRRIYELIRHSLIELPVNYDIVCIVVSAEVRDISAESLEKEWHEVVSKTSIHLQ